RRRAWRPSSGAGSTAKMYGSGCINTSSSGRRDRLRRTRRSRTETRRPIASRHERGWRGVSRLVRQDDVHPQAVAKRRIEQLDGRAVQFGGSLHDRQAEAVAVAATAGFAMEAGEYRRPPLARNAGAVVRYIDRGGRLAPGKRQLHLAAGGHVAHGIFDEIAQ